MQLMAAAPTRYGVSRYVPRDLLLPVGVRVFQDLLPFLPHALQAAAGGIETGAMEREK
jgi:hypothetical protein